MSRMSSRSPKLSLHPTSLILLCVLFSSAVSTTHGATIQKNYLVIPSLFSDNMVLQQRSEVPVWGKAVPKASVFVSGSWGASSNTTVNADSSWELKLKTVKAGGPYTLRITVGDSTTLYRNVMLGEVWVCSGQSNMEIPLEGWPTAYPVKNSAEEISKADYPQIRFFHVERAFSPVPEFNCRGTWTECTPATAAKFSAVGYFFGRKLFEELHVPIGLIWSVWGGTEIQPWISGTFLRKIHSYRQEIDSLECAAGLVEAQQDWVQSHRVIDVDSRNPGVRWTGLDFGDSSCSLKHFDDSSWPTMNLPSNWLTGYENENGHFNGAVWFRKRVQIPKAWIHTSLTVELGPVDYMDETWVDGVKVGGLQGENSFGVPRVYHVPANVVDDTSLVLAVRITVVRGYGGIWGGGVRMEVRPNADSTGSVPLSGEWKYMPVAEYSNGKYFVYDSIGDFLNRPRLPFAYSEYMPTVLFNGMIAPLIPYRIRGVTWYQGESNVGQPYDYKNLFPLLIKNWRHDWGEGNFPFYWVQIAPFPYGMDSKSYVVRDAQRLALSLPNTGMAVTLDIGSLDVIHPPDKQDVGLRLALWALARNYGRHLVYSGPIYKSMRVSGRNAILTFKYADNGLVFRPLDGRTNFIIAGSDSAFVKADVKVEGDKLMVYSPSVKHPIAVRYAWGNSEEATLFNKAGLPASTFRTDNWKEE